MKGKTNGNETGTYLKLRMMGLCKLFERKRLLDMAPVPQCMHPQSGQVTAGGGRGAGQGSLTSDFL